MKDEHTYTFTLETGTRYENVTREQLEALNSRGFFHHLRKAEGAQKVQSFRLSPGASFRQTGEQCFVRSDGEECNFGDVFGLGPLGFKPGGPEHLEVRDPLPHDFYPMSSTTKLKSNLRTALCWAPAAYGIYHPLEHGWPLWSLLLTIPGGLVLFLALSSIWPDPDHSNVSEYPPNVRIFRSEATEGAAE